MTRHNLVLGSALASIALATACRPPGDEAEEFRRGVPTQDTVSATIPGQAGQALTVQAAIAVRRATAESYKLTYGVTRLINGGAVFVGTLVRAVLRFPATTLQGDTAVWGPWTGDLEPVTWKLTVTRIAPHQFQYRFEGQPRGNPTAPFVTVLSGTHTAAVDGQGDPVEGFGAGSFTLDWDARATLPGAKAREVGTVDYTYARQPGAVTAVDASFHQILDDNDKRVDVAYAYTHQPGGGGTMDFVDTAAAQHGMPGGSWAVRSRWQPSGAGRTDARATIQSLGGALTASECWDTGFASTFVVHSWEPAAGYGAESDCPYTPAEYSKL
jgi:hypothetical protein